MTLTAPSTFGETGSFSEAGAALGSAAGEAAGRALGSAADVAAQLASGAWAQGGAEAFRVAFADPGATTVKIVSWALEYVHPLDTWLDALTGDKVQVSAFAQTWTGVSSSLHDAREQVVSARSTMAEQKGQTARAVRKRLDDLDGALTEAGDWSNAAAKALELASTIVTAVHDAIIGALSELAGLVMDLFGFTINPFSKIDDLKKVIHRAGEFIKVIGQLIDRMTTAFEQLKALLEALLPVIGDILEKLRPILAKMVHVAAIGIGAGVGSAFGPLGTAGGAVVGGLFGGAAADLIQPDRRVTDLDPSVLSTQEQRTAYEQANGVTRLDSLSDAVRQNGYADQIGAAERSVVDIKQIVGDDGQTRYVVALPSTQDWNFPWKQDQGSLGDLDTNVALVTMDNPALRTQYERAVMQAMQDAGVPPGAHVVYTGFSQGGIMAASIAEHDRTYVTDAIITNGAPIGTFDIPPSTRVVSFEHAADPVPIADGQYTDSTASDPNRTNVKLPNPPEGWDPMSTHNNAHYTQSVAAWEAANPEAAADVRSMITGRVVDHQFHAFNE
ncbi:hypothetical protein GCM10027515_05480 [Schumannella luteola]|uniref:Uncharacterized protein n=1 Tax=Schumannella luteola TaxID=472059 RepID=A0A852YKR3_9MICO|nr:hypothetical protein [Schumannella luteola]NYG98319.1 hypothetical protein [Schumannella luteola]TPX05749.1 hypothetical protein FJ656_04785 [Schumannella luteola]